MKRNFTRLLCGVACFFSTTASGQVMRAFTPRFKITARGAMVFVSNSILKSTNVVPTGYGYTPHAAAPDTAELPPGAGVASPAVNNGAYVGAHIDVDGDSTTFSSSSAQLFLPPCYSVEFAGLYWGAGAAINMGTGLAATGPTPFNAVTGWGAVKLRVPNATGYAPVAASTLDTVLTAVYHGYQAFADVTSMVQSAGPGTYTLADAKCVTGKVNTYGGWTMVVVYRDSTQPTRNITVFDGIAGLSGATTPQVNILLSGFEAPPAPAPVNFLMGAVLYDGDRAMADGFSVRDTAGAFIDQTVNGGAADSSSNPGDAWNSSITYLGTNVTTRTPAFANTFGYDADVFAIPNSGKRYVRNGDTTATIRLSSSSEGLLLGLVASQIDNFAPEPIVETTLTDLNGGGYRLGDTVLVTATVRNAGTDTALGAVFSDARTAALAYVPGSAVVGGVAQTDAGGDDVTTYNALTKRLSINLGTGATATTGGALRSLPGEAHTFSYKMRISTQCSDVGLTPVTLAYAARLAYTGHHSGLADSTGTRAAAGGGCTQPVAAAPVLVDSGCASVALGQASIVLAAHRNQSGDAQLEWTAENVTPHARFVVEASADGAAFAEVARMDGAGERHFSYVDQTLAHRGRTAYRVRGVQPDGSVVYSPARWLLAAEGLAETDVQVYPNPARDVLVVRGAQAGVSVALFNAQGLAVVAPARATAGGVVLDVSGLPRGLYLLRIRQGDGAIWRRVAVQ